MAPVNNHRKGFTLIELILGISIFALMALTFLAVFSNGVRINGKAEKSDQLYRELRWAMDTLTSDLENMVSYEGFQENGGGFHGDEKSLSLILPTASGLKSIHYALQLPKRGKVVKTVIGQHFTKNTDIVLNYTEENKIESLVREERPFSQSAEADSEPEAGSGVISPHVKPASLKFFYAAAVKKDDPDASVAWLEKWSDVHPPSMVRVELSFVDPDDAKNPPLWIQKDIFIPAGSWGAAQ